MESRSLLCYLLDPTAKGEGHVISVISVVFFLNDEVGWSDQGIKFPFHLWEAMSLPESSVFKIPFLKPTSTQ